MEAVPEVPRPIQAETEPPVTAGRFRQLNWILPIFGLLLIGTLQCDATPLCEALWPTCPSPSGFPRVTLRCDNLDPIYYYYGDDSGPFCMNGALATGNIFTFDATSDSLFAYACNLPCHPFDCVRFSLYQPNPNYCGMRSPGPPASCSLCRAEGGICTTAGCSFE